MEPRSSLYLRTATKVHIAQRIRGAIRPSAGQCRIGDHTEITKQEAYGLVAMDPSLACRHCVMAHRPGS